MSFRPGHGGLRTDERGAGRAQHRQRTSARRSVAGVTGAEDVAQVRHGAGSACGSGPAPNLPATAADGPWGPGASAEPYVGVPWRGLALPQPSQIPRCPLARCSKHAGTPRRPKSPQRRVERAGGRSPARWPSHAVDRRRRPLRRPSMKRAVDEKVVGRRRPPRRRPRRPSSTRRWLGVVVLRGVRR